MKKISMRKTVIAAAVTLGFSPAAMADSTTYPFSIAVGGGATRVDAGAEPYAPDWLSRYSTTFPGPVSFANEPDWGHQRQLTLSWAPTEAWRVTGAYRYGKAGTASRGSGYEHVPGGYAAGFKYATDPTDVRYVESEPNHWIGHVRIQEEIEVVDFKVGRDIGIGSFNGVGASVLSLGLRYAELQSTTSTDLDGTPDRYSPALFDEDAIASIVTNLPKRHFTQYTHASVVRRDFEGYGPSLSWQSAVGLLGDPQQGQVTLDWMLGTGVLFGEQTVQREEKRLARYYRGKEVLHSAFPTSVTYDETASSTRSRNATVPHLSLELGLSYAIQRMQLSLRYSWERYYGAIDGGADARKNYDRTVQGPMAQLVIGFGG